MAQPSCQLNMTIPTEYFNLVYALEEDIRTIFKCYAEYRFPFSSNVYLTHLPHQCEMKLIGRDQDSITDAKTYISSLINFDAFCEVFLKTEDQLKLASSLEKDLRRKHFVHLNLLSNTNLIVLGRSGNVAAAVECLVSAYDVQQTQLEQRMKDAAARSNRTQSSSVDANDTDENDEQTKLTATFHDCSADPYDLTKLLMNTCRLSVRVQHSLIDKMEANLSQISELRNKNSELKRSRSIPSQTSSNVIPETSHTQSNRSTNPDDGCSSSIHNKVQSNPAFINQNEDVCVKPSDDSSTESEKEEDERSEKKQPIFVDPRHLRLLNRLQSITKASMIPDDARLLAQKIAGLEKTPIVIDGLNLAYDATSSNNYRLERICAVIIYLVEVGCSDVKVVLPSWLHGYDPNGILQIFKESNMIAYSPATTSTHDDDMYVLTLAFRKCASIISNDKYRQYVDVQSGIFKNLIELRLIPYMMVDDIFIPADPPLGANGAPLWTYLVKRPKT